MSTSDLPNEPIFLDTNAPIWRIMPDPVSSNLVIETREQTTRSIRAYCVPLSSPKLRPMTVDTNWWRSLTHVHQGRALWQGYQDNGMPELRGMYVFDIETCDSSWEYPDLTCAGLGPEVALAIAPEDPTTTLLIDWQTGHIRDRIRSTDIPQELIQQFEQARFQQILFPVHDSPLLSTSSQEASPVSSLPYQHVTISHQYRPAKRGGWDATLTIINSLGETQATFPAGHYPGGFGMDPFLVLDTWLIWLIPPFQFAILDLSFQATS